MDRIGRSMTGDEMAAWLPGARIMTYKQLGAAAKRGATLGDVLGPHGVLVLLYLLKPNVGHWCVVFRRTPDVVEFFDSYSSVPDEEFRFVPRNFRAQSFQDYRWLTKLLYESPYRTEYNEIPFQADGPGIATCGRHCIARLAFSDLSIAEYQRRFKGLPMDAVVAEAIPNLPPW